MNTVFSRLINRIISSSLFRKSGIYTFTSIINAGIPLLLLPILTHKLTPADYGIVAMFQLAVSVILPFIGMNLEASITRKYYDRDDTDFSSYVGSCILLILCSFILVIGVSWICFDYIKQIIQIPELWIKYIYIVAICQIIVNVILAIYQVKEQPLKYGLLQILQSIFNVGFTIFFIMVMNKTWNGRIEAQVISGVVFALISLIILWKTGLIAIDIKKKIFVTH
jgi:O-antigen/teichoic acid export membrane protein